jgi:hypothetical protein
MRFFDFRVLTLVSYMVVNKISAPFTERHLSSEPILHLISMITRKAFPRNPWNKPDPSCSLVCFVPTTDLPPL